MKSWTGHGEREIPLLQRWINRFKLDLCLSLLSSVNLIDLHGKSLIYVCCGSGIEAEYFNERGTKTVGIDISTSQLKEAKKRTEDCVLADAECLPFRSNAFDNGLVVDGLHHLPNPYDGVSEIIRTVRDVVVFIDIFNSLMTRITTLMGFITHEWCGIKPNRIEEKYLRRSLNNLEIKHYEIVRFFSFPSFICYNNMLSNYRFINLLMQIFLKLNSLVIRSRSLGLFLGNVGVGIGLKVGRCQSNEYVRKIDIKNLGLKAISYPSEEDHNPHAEKNA